MNPGDKVQITDKSAFDTCMWWPAGIVTGTVQKVFKNGFVAVAVHQLPLAGGDGLRTLHIKRHQLITIGD